MSEGFEIVKTLVVSSAHLRGKTYTKLTKEKNHKIIWDDLHLMGISICSLVWSEYTYGWRVFSVNDLTEEGLTSIGFSEGFIKSIVLAKALGVDRIEFDSDGPVIGGIPEY